jgi:carboxypeptidase C (cathepsin A)
LESPPGVGFSINNISNYVFSDEHTAETSFLSVQEWFKRFIGYTKNKFWISGESYAGMYIPFLADKIRVNNLSPREDTIKLDL